MSDIFARGPIIKGVNNVLSTVHRRIEIMLNSVVVVMNDRQRRNTIIFLMGHTQLTGSIQSLFQYDITLRCPYELVLGASRIRGYDMWVLFFKRSGKIRYFPKCAPFYFEWLFLDLQFRKCPKQVRGEFLNELEIVFMKHYAPNH